MDPRTIILDGYNVIRNLPGLSAAEKRSMETGRDALCAAVVSRYRHTPHRVIIVFDGDGPQHSILPLKGLARGQVIYTQAGVSADSVIAELSAAESARGMLVAVVTNDLEIRSAVRDSGGSIHNVSDLHSAISGAPKNLRRLAAHRAYVRGLESSDVDVDSPKGQRSKGNPHRSKRTKRSGPRTTLPD